MFRVVRSVGMLVLVSFQY